MVVLPKLLLGPKSMRFVDTFASLVSVESCEDDDGSFLIKLLIEELTFVELAAKGVNFGKLMASSSSSEKKPPPSVVTDLFSSGSSNMAFNGREAISPLFPAFPSAEELGSPVDINNLM